eukprot:6208873-Pleurochrysis_carterae.AAC.3
MRCVKRVKEPYETSSVKGVRRQCVTSSRQGGLRQQAEPTMHITHNPLPVRQVLLVATILACNDAACTSTCL